MQRWKLTRVVALITCLGVQGVLLAACIAASRHNWQVTLNRNTFGGQAWASLATHVTVIVTVVVVLAHELANRKEQ